MNLRTIEITQDASQTEKRVVGKIAALRELQALGAARDAAMTAIQLASSRPNGYELITVNGAVIEVWAMNTEKAWKVRQK